MTLQVDQNGSDLPNTGADHDSPAADPKALAAAGFEAGLSVVVDAMPACCVVFDRSCHLVTFNRASDALVRVLKRPETLAALKRAAENVSRSEDQSLVCLPLGTNKSETYVVVPLGGPYAQAASCHACCGGFLGQARSKETRRALG
ncbi:MAG: hypothetical protein AAFY25_04025, partial [Pseudomonadota bacterium]